MSHPIALGVIPARYESKRLPGKPLKDIAGRVLLERVWLRAKSAKLLGRIIIATDDKGIYQAALGFGAEALMTKQSHQSGTDRASEVLEVLESEGQSYPLVANIQGDMPFINPEVIDSAIEALHSAGPEVGIGSVCVPMLSEGDFLRPSAVKVVMDDRNDALYFSRAPIPYWRERDVSDVSEQCPFGFKHLGLYVYRNTVLKQLTSLPQSVLEKRECLEQLRALSNGIRIRMAIVPREALEPSIEVDTPEDLELARRIARSSSI